MKTIRAFIILAALLATVPALAVQSVVWDKTPIRINLIVGVEQMIHLPDDGQIGLPPSLANPGMFAALYVGKTAYWRALQPFAAERIKVRLNSGEFILFDVSARVEKKPPARVEPLNVVISESNDTTIVDRDEERKTNIFELIRYAAQVTYSPARLVEPLDGVREVPLGIKGNLNGLYNHRDHFGLVFRPAKSWTLDGLYVTAVTVINRHSHAMTLDNRLVQHTKKANIHGVERHFVASSFYRRQLESHGKKGDRTTLFIVTDKPFTSAIRL